MIERNQLDELFRVSDGKSPVALSVGDHMVPIKFLWSNKSKHLLISFHGAIDRKARTPPVFPPIVQGLGDQVAQLSVSDPSMLRPGLHAMSWYAGDEDFSTQTVLSELFRQIIDIGGFERVIFFGGSGGGFASLYYSSLIPGSVAVVGNPQTNMRRYYSEHIKKYVQSCWPSLNTEEELSEKVCTDLCEWYSKARHNTVIYIQSAGDRFHTWNHFVPFLSSIAKAQRERIIVNTDYWGKLGHSGSVSVSTCSPWLRTVFLANTLDISDLLQTYYSLASLERQPKFTESAVRRQSSSVPEEEIRFATLLRDYHLR